MASESPKTGLPVSFGSYQLLDFVGKGGMAEIFWARARTHLGLGRSCVIKRILPELCTQRDFCEMLIQEAKVCSNLSHVNVVKTLDLGQFDGQYFIAMEYVDGVDLNRLLGILSRARVRLPLPYALHIVRETLKGLDYAHRYVDAEGRSYHIVHRDVSPTNVLISFEGEVKICDFGIARAAIAGMGTGTASLDETHIKGKVAYMAPEHVAGQEIDQRADIYAAGIILWELLSGRRLFKRKDPKETLALAMAADIPPVVDRGFAEPEMLFAIVRKALQKDPQRRFSDGRTFIRAIDDYLHLTNQVVSPMQFGAFLAEHLGQEIVARRNERMSLGDLDVTGEMPLMAPDDEERSRQFTTSFLNGLDKDPLEAADAYCSDEKNDEKPESSGLVRPPGGRPQLVRLLIGGVVMAGLLVYGIIKLGWW